MNTFDFEMRTRIVFGPGTLDRVGEISRELGATRAMVVADPGIVAAGYVDRAGRALRDAGIEPFVFDGVEENPTTEHVAAATEFGRSRSIDFILGLGGGSSMDCAKGANFILTNGGEMRDYRGRDRATEPMLPFVAIPTTAGTGSEAQSFALVSDAGTHEKMACGDRKAAARVAILDPMLTVSQPRIVAAQTGIDAISHAVESYVSKSATPASRLFARRAWGLLAGAFERIFAAPADLDARAAMQLGAHYAGISIENSMLGAAHSCANPLTARFGLAHGAAIGVVLPHVVRWNAPAVGELYAELLAESDGVAPPPEEAGDALAAKIESLRATARLPATLSECGADPVAIPKMARAAAAQWTAAHNPVALAETDFVSLYEDAF